MRGMKPLLLLCVAGSLLASGCTSTRMTTNRKPEADPATPVQGQGGAPGTVQALPTALPMPKESAAPF